MKNNDFSRRDYLKLLGAGAAAAATDLSFLSTPGLAIAAEQQAKPADESAATIADRARRMKWWHEAKFGMFIHWGLYSVLGRHEWVMEMEGIPATEYQEIAKRFKPLPNAARDWAKLGKARRPKIYGDDDQASRRLLPVRYATTNYCAPKQGPGRDLVREYVDAARAEGLRVVSITR